MGTTHELEGFLEGVQRRLNRRLLLGTAFEALAASSFGALAIIEGLAWALGGFWSLAPVRVIGLLLLDAAVVAALVGWAWRHRLSRAQAALWLDQAAKTGEVFAAAEGLMDQTTRGFEAQSVLETAERERSVLVAGSTVRLPARRLAIRASVAGVLLVLTVGAVLWWSPPVTATPVSPSAPFVATAEEDRDDTPPTPQSVAKRLFPSDARLAALAEQALVAGDTQALETLVNAGFASPTGATSDAQAAQNYLDQPNDPSAPATARRLPPDQQQGNPSGRVEPAPGTNGPLTGRPDSGGGGQKGDAAPTPFSLDLPGGPPGQQKPGSSESGGTPLSGGGSGQGTGHSDLPLGEPLLPLPSAKTLISPDKSKPGLFEILLPGRNEFLPLNQAVSPAAKSAEAALKSKSPPLEFQNTVRDYFEVLSQEVKP